MDKDVAERFFAKLAEKDEAHQEALRVQQDAMRAQQEAHEAAMQRLLDTLAGNVRPGAPAAPAHAPRPPAEIRKEKLSSLFQMLQKSVKLKDYKHSSPENIREWLKKLDVLISSLAKGACDLDLDANALTRDEYIPLLYGKLDYSIIKEIDQKFTTRAVVLTWETVTKAQVHEILLEQFGAKEPDISSLLKHFGANRFKKAARNIIEEFLMQMA